MGLNTRDSADLPLHCKPVGRSVDFRAAADIEVTSALLKDEWLHSVKWCTDTTRYARVRTGKPLTTKLCDADIDAMIAAGTVV